MLLSLNNEMICIKEYIYIYVYYIKVVYICVLVKCYCCLKIFNIFLRIVWLKLLFEFSLIYID